MAGAHKTLKDYVLTTRIAASLLMILVYAWMAIYPLPDVSVNWFVSGLGMIFTVLGLYGLWKLNKAFFLGSNLTLAAIHIPLIIATALTTVQDVVVSSLLLLTVIFLVELGGSSILFSRIVRGIREPSDGEVVSRIRKAMSRHLIDISAIVAMTFVLSGALLSLGSITIPTVMPSYIVAAEIVVLLVSVVLLGSRQNSR